MTTFHLPNAETYLAEYDRLADSLGVPHRAPAPGEVEFLREVTVRERFPFSMMTGAELFFAGGVASLLAPRLAIEIGTASGFSAAVLGKVIAMRAHESGRPLTGPLLHTIDLKTEDKRATTQPIGYAIAQVTPELQSQIVVHPLRDSTYARELVRGDELTLAFVDGNHQHPWPLHDVLQLQSLMPSGWILLHDIDLPHFAGDAYTPRFGAKYVFDSWPDKKIGAGNIGAIKLPENRRSLGQLVAHLRELPSEVSPNGWKKRWQEIDALLPRLA
ncbi:MAG: class I SAM-dependent methyltransferase [Chthoniobacterales bacterium]|nr:class I SAM-dependent methyltransferase [Chthoniobacterales bacterium]